MADLSAYQSIRTNLFVRVDVAQYRTTSGGSYTSQVLRFTDEDTATSINSETYTPLGKLLNITSRTSEIRPSGDSITVSLSGIPTDSVEEIIYSKIKGSGIKIYRNIYNVNHGLIETQSYFVGRVVNFSIQEEFDVEQRSSSLSLLLECTNNFSILEAKLAGRKTNSASQKSFASGDLSMDRVATVQDTKFDFGAP